MNFYPRSPCGERLGLIFYFVCCIIISIHALLAESDQAKALKVSTLSNFYPRSPCGERRKLLVSDCQQQYFYPRSPCGERRRNRKLILIIRHFYPRSPCGERPKNTSIAGRITSISIHALLAESDESKLPSESHTRNFYPRSPCGERLDSSMKPQPEEDISIHALLAESDLWVLRKVPILSIFLSTLSLRRATRNKFQDGRNSQFLSTLSLRRAT